MLELKLLHYMLQQQQRASPLAVHEDIQMQKEVPRIKEAESQAQEGSRKEQNAVPVLKGS